MDQKQIIKIGITIILGILLMYLISMYYGKSLPQNENFVDTEMIEEEGDGNQNENEMGDNYNVQPSENIGDNVTFNTIDSSKDLEGNQQPNDCFPKDKLNPSDLLPGDANSQWAQVNPVGQGELSDQNFLDAGYHVGVNTVGQTLRNANLQIRSEPPNPQVKVSPWLQTTIEPDTNRQPIEIGGCQ
jgi:hypothetical protein